MNFRVKLKIRLSLVLISLMIFSFEGSSQSRFFYSFFPGISVSAPLSDNFELNLSTFAQYNTLGRQYEGVYYPAAFNYFDFQIGGVYKYNQHLHFAAAWYFRSSDPGRNSAFSENRFWQQVSVISRIDHLRIRNRLRIEQRMITRSGQTDPLKWRLRYQAGIEIPLQGEKTDPREFYMTVLNEAYFSLNKPRPAFYGENWFSALLGYRISARSRLEFGPSWQMQIRNAEKETNNYFHFQASLLIQTNIFRKNL